MTEPVSSAERARLGSLTGLRFWAALLVFVDHAFTPSVVHGGLARLPGTRDLAEAGATGVTFFFVLSGFVLTWSWSDSLPRKTFYGRRFARIYPLHLLLLVAVCPLVLVPTGIALPGPGAALADVLLLQAWVPDPGVFFSGNGPSWSLSCEAAFYASLPFLLPLLRRSSVRQRWAVAAGAVLVLAAVPLLVWAWPPGDHALLSLWVFPPYRGCEFVLGVLLALAMKEGWRPAWPERASWVLAGTALCVAALVLRHARGTKDPDLFRLAVLYADLAVLVPFTAVIASAAASDLAGRGSWLSHPWMRALGNASFALYLSHASVILLVHEFAPGTLLSFAAGLPLTLVTLAVCLAVAGALHMGVERTLEARIRASLPVQPVAA